MARGEKPVQIPLQYRRPRTTCTREWLRVYTGSDDHGDGDRHFE